MDEVCGAVEGVDDPGVAFAGVGVLPSGFFAEERVFGKGIGYHFADDFLGVPVGFGDEFAAVFAFGDGTGFGEKPAPNKSAGFLGGFNGDSQLMGGHFGIIAGLGAREINFSGGGFAIIAGMRDSAPLPARFPLAESPAAFWAGAGAMAGILAVSNWLVLLPLNDWLTWGHFSYPLAFLVTDCVNRAAGARVAGRVVAAGFVFGVPLSFAASALFGAGEGEGVLLAAGRVAGASGAAFLCGQVLDVAVFNRLRDSAWWRAPVFSSAAGSLADTFLFYFLAFAGSEGLPWATWALGDLLVKAVMLAALLPPYRFFIFRLAVARGAAGI